jgi:hypothetical protein
MDELAKGMSQAGQQEESALRPKKGDRFRCASCGMRLRVTADCKCEDDDAHFHCCGQEMEKL